MESLPEAWLRGPVEGVPPHLQPVAHGLRHYGEEMIAALEGLTLEQLCARPNGVASIAYHVQHALGSMDRLFTYARGEPLDENQKRALADENGANERRVEPGSLVAAITKAVDGAISELKTIEEKSLLDYRAVGRMKLPSTVIGLLSHAAEHLARHTGQVVTMSRIVR